MSNDPNLPKRPEITTPEQLSEDATQELSLRPQRLAEFIGQPKVKDSLQIAIDAALNRREPLDHVLLYGPPGLGKTTLGMLIAREMGVNIKITSGPVLEKPGDLHIGGTHQVQHLDRRAVRVERRARGKNDGRGGSADHQHHQGARQPLQRRDQLGQRRQPLCIVVDPGRRRHRLDRVAQPVEPEVAGDAEIDVDDRRHGKVRFHPAGADPGLEELGDLRLGDSAHRGDARKRARGLGGGFRLVGARIRIGFDDLDRDPLADIRIEALGGAVQP